jgi:hypothetical protein
MGGTHRKIARHTAGIEVENAIAKVMYSRPFPMAKI